MRDEARGPTGKSLKEMVAVHSRLRTGGTRREVVDWQDLLSDRTGGLCTRKGRRHLFLHFPGRIETQTNAFKGEDQEINSFWVTVKHHFPYKNE